MSKDKRCVPYKAKSRATGKTGLYRNILMEFWNKHRRGSLDKRKHPSVLGKEAVIADLIKLGEFKFDYKNLEKFALRNRIRYNNKKNRLRGYTGFEVCFACSKPAQCRHHVVWLKNGGRNSRRNICPLCNDCHAEIHPWLKT